MGVMIEKKSALKVFFYCVAIDGKICDEEKSKVDEIGAELMGDQYEECKDEISAEFVQVLGRIENGDEAYDIIQEAVDVALTNKVKKDGVNSRLLLWDLFAITHVDNEHSQEEERLLNHIARLLQIDKSVVAEMKQLIYTINKTIEEHALLEESMEPYRNVRPMVVELEKRFENLLQAGKELILDENIYIYEKSESTKKKEDLLSKTGKALGDAGKATIDGIGSAGEAAAKGISGLWGGVGKLFGKSTSSSDEKQNESREEE